MGVVVLPSVRRVLPNDSSEAELPLSAVDHPRLVGLHSLWNSRRGSRRMPSRADFTPEVLAPFLGYVVLVDVEEAPRRFRYRLIGTEIVSSYGVELTGRYTTAVQPDAYRGMVERHYGQAVDEARPVAHLMSFSEAPGKVHELLRLTLPLSDDDRRVSMLMLASVFGPDLARFRERERQGLADKPD